MAESDYNNRRQFIKKIGVSGASISMLGASTLFSSSLYGGSKVASKKDIIKLTILHTNDLHSRIDPFHAKHQKYANQGGLLQIAKMVKDIRKKESNVLLLDAGDIFQGTPYFNLFGGEVEFKIMSEMGYDCATMGNHDFDNGIEGFDKMLPHCNFPFVTSNYDFSDTLLHQKTKNHHIIYKDNLKIGVFGIGIALEGIVNKAMYGATRYLDPIEVINSQSKKLKQDLKCDLVICLSHLGYEYNTNKISDLKVAEQSENLDIIIGGHTHTFLPKATVTTNKVGEKIVINQAGWAGLLLGRIDILFNQKTKKPIDLQSANQTSKNYQ